MVASIVKRRVFSYLACGRGVLGRIKTLIGKLFHAGYTVEGTWKLMRRHGWQSKPGDRPFAAGRGRRPGRDGGSIRLLAPSGE
jgi:hypothetical protein